MTVDVPREYISLPINEKQQYVQNLQNDVSELQATLDEIRCSAPRNVLSQRKHEVLPYPPVVKFKPTKNVRANLKHKVVGMRGLTQPGGYLGLVSMAQNGTAILWDSATGMKYESFHIGKGSTMALGANSNGTVLAAGGLSCFVEVYSIGAKLREMTGQETAMDLSNNRFDAGTAHWNTGRANQYRFSLSGHDAAISAISFLDATHLVSGALDSSVFVWDVTTAVPVSTIREIAPVTGIDTSQGSLYASSTQEGTLKVWDIRERDGHAQHMTSTLPLTGCKFMPDGQSVLTSVRHGLQLFDLRCNTVLEEYNFKGGSITTMDVSSSGRMAVIGTETGSILPIDLVQNWWFPPIDKRKDAVSGVVVQGGSVYASGWDGSIKSYTYAQ